MNGNSIPREVSNANELLPVIVRLDEKMKSLKNQLKEGQSRATAFEEKMEKNIEEIKNCIQRIEVKLAEQETSLKIKSGFWGLIGGILALLPTLILFLIQYLRK